MDIPVVSVRDWGNGRSPACSSAWTAAAMARRSERDARLREKLDGISFSGWKSLTSPPVFVRWADVSNRVIGPIPHIPSCRAAAYWSVLPAMAFTVPIPVMTTRFRFMTPRCKWYFFIISTIVYYYNEKYDSRHYDAAWPRSGGVRRRTAVDDGPEERTGNHRTIGVFLRRRFHRRASPWEYGNMGTPQRGTSGYPASASELGAACVGIVVSLDGPESVNIRNYEEYLFDQTASERP